MKLIRSDDELVSKYIHIDNSETAIKCVSSCDTIKNPVTGVLELNNVDRNKYSVFVSSSAGCYMKCGFCYLTMKEMKYKKLNENQVIKNLKDAIIKEYEINPSIKDKYIKICWMGMGDAINNPEMVYNVTLLLLHWVFENKYAKGLDGVDLSTVLPKVQHRWMNVFKHLEKGLEQFPMNPLNNIIVHSEKDSNVYNYTTRSRFRLFFSVHSGNQENRDKMIPNAMPLREALSQIKDYSNYNKRNVVFHHMFIDGVNDYKEEVNDFLRFIYDYGLTDYEFRILRYNRYEGNDIKESGNYSEIINRISNKIKNLKIQISTGREIQSACGQFITPN